MAFVLGELREGTTVSVQARQFTWKSDEPPGIGGDEGPTPYEILLGALASCTAITLRLYANHKGLRLDAATVRVEFDRVHADDCEDCDERAEGWLERVRTHVTMRGVFTEAQRTRLTQVARRCPVHKTLANPVHFDDAVTFEDVAGA